MAAPSVDQKVLVELVPEEEKADEEMRPSLFERVTRTGRAAIGRVVADSNPERRVGAAEVIEKVDFERTSAQQPPVADSSMVHPAAEVVTGSTAIAAGTVDGVLMSETGIAPEEEDADDLLDIPAFLRRQAN